MRRILAHRGMTLIELLIVIAIIITIMAMAVPNFGTMMRSQKWSAASTSLQNTLLRIQTMAVTDRRDYSAEFCTSADNSSQYFRLEVESAALESIPEMNNYLHVTLQNHYYNVPIDWLGIFCSGGGVQNGSASWDDGSPVSYSYTGPRYDVNSQDWRSPNQIKDNLKVDDNVYLPYSIRIDVDCSTNLINYDKPPLSASDMPQYGWDYTKDLRFNMNGMLVQSQNPEVMLKMVEFTRTASHQEVVLERMRLQIMRSTGRVRELSGGSH